MPVRWMRLMRIFLLSLVLLLPNLGCVTLTCFVVTAGRGNCREAISIDGAISDAIAGAAIQSATAASAGGRPQEDQARQDTELTADIARMGKFQQEPRRAGELPEPPTVGLTDWEQVLDESRELRMAQTDLSAGRYVDALARASLLTRQPAHRQAAWLVVGLAACGSGDAVHASAAVAQLGAERAVVLHRCAQRGITL